MKPISALLRKHALSLLLCLSFLSCAWPCQAIGQSAQSQSVMPSQLKPLSRSQLYWAFLSYQNHLDKLAADDQAKGKDGSWLRNDLQKRLGFSDQDYAPIRTSAQRLTSKVQVLAEKAKQIRAAGSSSGSTQAQALSGLTKQRHEYIGNEINSLIQALSPQNKAALEAFMTQFFSPKNLTFSAPPSVGQSAGTAVQK